MLVFCLITSNIYAQSDSDLSSQMQRMKHDYQEWLSGRPNNNLFVEYDPSPIALDIENPRFTWIVELEGRSRMQTAYQVLVASSMELLGQDKGDIWDTGLVESEQSAQVQYGGQALESNRQYFWKVRIRDEKGKLHNYCEPGTFNTGFINEDDWTAEWIGRGSPDEPVANVDLFPSRNWSDRVDKLIHEPRAPLFRREFTIEKKVRRARIFVAGPGLFELSLNGEKVGDDVLAQTKTDFRKRILYNTYDITDELESGPNALGIMLGNGWFNGQKKFWGWQYQWYGSPRVILQLEIEYYDGTRESIITDKRWKASWSPIIFNCLFDGEHYDARLEQEGWDSPGFDDSSWSPVNVVPSPGGKLRSALHEPGKVSRIIETISLNEPRQDTFVFDLGQNIAGFVRLKVEGPKGTLVKLKFAEQLHPDGMIDPSSSRAALQEDHYILKGEGVEIFEPRFTYHGFQYVQVTGFPGTPGKDAIEGHFIQNSVSPAGSFSCSNDLINRIHLCTIQSQLSNIQMGVPTDDTQRPERQGWGADALMTAQEAMLNMTIQRVYAKYYRDYQDQQDQFGRIGFMAPRAGIAEDLVWSSCFVIMPWYQYIHYGDIRVLKENYESILLYINFLTTRGRPDIKPKEEGDNPLFPEYEPEPQMIGQLQYSQWGDHLSLAEGYHSRSGLPLSISTAFYYHDIKVLEKIARVLGKVDHAKKLNTLGINVLKAFNDKFLDKDKGYYDIGSQASQTWPLLFGMVPEDYEKAVMKRLIQDIVEINDTHPTTGYASTKFMIDLLSEKGREDLVWKMANNTDFPSWAWSLRNGKTTITEKWTDGGSQNHVVLGAAIDPWFYNVLAGIRPEEKNPGYKNFIIEPYVPEQDLDWVNASIHTVNGTISSSWEKKEGGMLLEFRIPSNTNAKVYLPSNNLNAIKEGGKKLSRLREIKILDSDKDKILLELGSGTYSFSISDISERK